MKRGGLDPYAYVPLNPRNLNPRARNKAHKAFENVVKAAKKGTQASFKKKKGGRK